MLLFFLHPKKLCEGLGRWRLKSTYTMDIEEHTYNRDHRLSLEYITNRIQLNERYLEKPTVEFLSKFSKNT